MSSVRSFRLAFLGGTVAAAIACNAFTGIGELDPSLTEADGGNASSSGGSSSGAIVDDGGGTTDAPPADATPFDANQPLAPVDIVDVGTADKSTGLSGQNHLVWAPLAQRWILFYTTSAAPSVLRSKISADFTTWTDGAELALPHANVDGRNLAIARAPLGAKDVFHLALSFRVAATDRRAYAARAVLTGATLAWNTPSEVTRSIVSDTALDPDGPAIGVSADGFVTLFTGYRTNNPDGSGGTGNQYALRSSVADDGVSAFAPTWTNFTIEIVPTIANARAAVALGQSDLLSVYEYGDFDPIPRNLRWARSNGATWGSELTVFASATPTDPADWAIHRSSDTDVHVVRRTTAGAFEHRRYDGNAMQAGGAIADEVLESGAGVTLVTLDSPSMMLVGAASSEALRGTTWNGTTWSAWSTVLPPVASGTRRWLSSGGAVVGPSAIVWTENRGASHVIAGVRIR
jgi:hypothetical protein